MFVSSTLLGGLHPGPVPGFFLRPSALQHADIHLASQGGGVKFFDHVHRSAGVARQGEHVDALAVEQSECDGGMAQAIKRERLAMRVAKAKARFSQHPFEPEIE